MDTFRWIEAPTPISLNDRLSFNNNNNNWENYLYFFTGKRAE